MLRPRDQSQLSIYQVLRPGDQSHLSIEVMWPITAHLVVHDGEAGDDYDEVHQQCGGRVSVNLQQHKDSK